MGEYFELILDDFSGLEHLFQKFKKREKKRLKEKRDREKKEIERKR